MALRFLAGPRADSVLAVGLDDVDVARAQQRPSNEVIEPELRQLPISLCPANPFGRRSPAVLQPLPIVIGKRQPHPKPLTTPSPAQNDRNWFLLPHVVESEPLHGLLLFK